MSLQKSRGHLFWGKNSLEQLSRKLGASKIQESFFWGKKTALSNVVRSQGLPKIQGPFVSEKNSLEQHSQKLGASKNYRI